MARSPSEASISSSAPPISESGFALPSGSPGAAPSRLPLEVPQQGVRGSGGTWLLRAAVVLAVLGVAAFVIPAAGAGHGRVFAAAGAVVVLLLAGVLFVLQRQRGAAVADVALWEQRARQAQHHAAEQQQRAALWEQRAQQE